MTREVESAADFVRQTSKAMLGNKYRLEVSAAVAEADDGLVYARELTQRLAATKPSAPADNQVGQNLQALAAAGLLLRFDGGSGSQPVYYQRRDSVYWAFCLTFIKEVQQSGARSVARTTTTPGNRRG